MQRIRFTGKRCLAGFTAKRCLAGLLAGAGLAQAATPAAAEATSWTLAPATSSVTMYATKQGAWFNGIFEKFSATIEFDPQDPATGRIVGVVETGTIATGDSQNDDYVEAYLDVARFPQAHFESRTIETMPEGFRAIGPLTLKGKTRDGTLDFVFSEDPSASSATLSGRMVIDRFDYDIANDVDTSWTGQEVTVIIELTLEQ